MSATESPAAGKKGKKKSKGKTLSLNDFLSDTKSGTNFVKDPPKAPPTTNWADATEDLDIGDITTNWPGEKPSENVFDRSVLPSGPRASQALQIDSRRLPKSPPYTVYLGNLSYECSEEDIKRFFDRKKLSASSIRLPLESGTSRLRGFGYAEFSSVQELMEALSLSGETLLNRPLQVDIASGKSGGGGGFDDMGGRGDRRRYDFGDDRTAGDWRRGGDSNHDMSPPYEGGRRYGGGDSYDRRSDDRYYDRGGRGPPGRSRGFGQGWSDRDMDGGGGGYYDDRRGGGDSYDRRDDNYGSRYNYRDDRYDRRDRPPRRGGPGGGYGGGGRDYYDGDRGGYGGPRRRSPDYDRRRDDGPAERPRLILQPRSKPIEEKKPDQTKSGPSSIFGGAKPVDTAAREKEIEERLLRDKQAEKERKERESIEHEEREKERERERTEKAARLFGGAKPVDTASREREIEEKLRREKEQFEKRLAEQSKDEREDRGSSQERHREGSRDRDRERVPRERRFSSRGDSSRERDSSDHHDDQDGGRRSNRRRSPLYQEKGRDRGESPGERGSTEDMRGRDSPYGRQQTRDRDQERERERPRRDRKDSRGDRDSRDYDRGQDGDRERNWDHDSKDVDYERDRDRGDGYRGRRRGDDDRERRGPGGGERGQGGRSRGRGNRRQSERDGEDRGGGPRGGGRGVRDRDGDGRDGGGQRKQHSGNAWSKGRPRISSSDGPPQMKKFEEPQVPTFSRPSRFAALQQDAEDINDDSVRSPDEEVRGQSWGAEPPSPRED